MIMNQPAGASLFRTRSWLTRRTSTRLLVRAFPAQRGLYEYAGNARHRAVGTHDSKNADDVIGRQISVPKGI